MATCCMGEDDSQSHAQFLRGDLYDFFPTNYLVPRDHVGYGVFRWSTGSPMALR